MQDRDFLKMAAAAVAILAAAWMLAPAWLLRALADSARSADGLPVMLGICSAIYAVLLLGFGLAKR